jgi:hypothetical protein
VLERWLSCSYVYHLTCVLERMEVAVQLCSRPTAWLSETRRVPVLRTVIFLVVHVYKKCAAVLVKCMESNADSVVRRRSKSRTSSNLTDDSSSMLPGNSSIVFASQKSHPSSHSSFPCKPTASSFGLWHIACHYASEGKAGTLANAAISETPPCGNMTLEFLRSAPCNPPFSFA